MSTLEIKHQIVMDGKEFIVRETFGDQKPIEWRVPSRAVADALVDERKTILLEMVASISTDAREAVDNARHIDNLRAGNA